MLLRAITLLHRLKVVRWYHRELRVASARAGVTRIIVGSEGRGTLGLMPEFLPGQKTGRELFQMYDFVGTLNGVDVYFDEDRRRSGISTWSAKL